MLLLDLLEKTFRKHGGLFITGTDTNVGKTYVACLVARALRARGLDVGAFKPSQSGPGDDAGMLARAAGSRDPRSLFNPYRFKAALAPSVAARLEGRRVSIPKVVDCFHRLRARHQGVLVEGAGGLLVPLEGTFLVADLAAKLNLPLLVVARPALGTLNHSLLSVSEARRRRLKVACVVFNGLKGAPGLAERTNPTEFRKLSGLPLAGPLPWGLKTLEGLHLVD